MQYYVQVRLRPHVRGLKLADGRLLTHHQLFANNHMVPADEAVRLLDRGIVKLCNFLSEPRLRAEVAASA